MEEDKKVDGAVAALPQEGDKVVTPPIETVSDKDFDYLAALAEKDKELAKVNEEKENYKKGLLIAKGKREDDGSYVEPDDDADARVRRIVQEENLKRDETRIIKEKEAIITQLAKERNELKTALGNRSQIGSTAQGGGSGGPQVQDSTFSPEQIAQLKARGLDPEKVKATMRKQANQPGVKLS